MGTIEYCVYVLPRKLFYYYYVSIFVNLFSLCYRTKTRELMSMDILEYNDPSHKSNTSMVNFVKLVSEKEMAIYLMVNFFYYHKLHQCLLCGG